MCLCKQVLVVDQDYFPCYTTELVAADAAAAAAAAVAVEDILVVFHFAVAWIAE